MKPANILVFRDQRCKIGDLGISVKIDSNDEGKKKYKLLGATPGFLPKEVADTMKSSLPLTKT